MLDTYSAHTVHSVHAVAGAQHAQYVRSMLVDAGTTGPTHHSCQIERTAFAPASDLTVAHATCAIIGMTGSMKRPGMFADRPSLPGRIKLSQVGRWLGRSVVARGRR